MAQDVLVNLHPICKLVAFFGVKRATAVLSSVLWHLPWQHQAVLALGSVDKGEFELVCIQTTRGTLLPQVERHFI